MPFIGTAIDLAATVAILPSMSFQRAFTLVELMVVIAVMAILATAGIPAFQKLINSNQLTAVSNDFITSLNYTRSEAIKRGTRVTMCRRKVDNGAPVNECGNNNDGTGWDTGWITFADPNGDAQFDTTDGDLLLRVHDQVRYGSKIRGNPIAAVAEYVSYVGTGFSQLANSGAFQAGTIIICDGDDKTRTSFDSDLSTAKAIVIGPNGRPVIKKWSDTDYINCNAEKAS